MTTPPNHPHKRHLGVLGVAIYTLLSPSGKIISSAAAATLLVGGLVTQLRPSSPPAAQAPAPTPVVPARLGHSGSSALVLTYIEVDGQTVPIVLTDHPTGNRSVGRGSASASPSVDLSGGAWPGSGPGSSNFGPRHGSPPPPNPGHGGSAAKAPPPSINPGPMAHPPGPDKLNCTPTKFSDSGSPKALPPGALPCPTHLADSGDPADKDSRKAGSPPPSGDPGNAPGGLSEAPGSKSSPENEAGAPMPPLPDGTPQIVLIKSPVPGGLSEAPGSKSPPESEAGAPMPPLPDGTPRIVLIKSPGPGNAPSPFEAPESQFPTGMDDPLNPLIPLSMQPDPLLTEPYDGQSPPQIAEASPVAVPEPSVIGLMLLGLAALGWTGRRRLTPTRRA